jgi:hypothetical protein
MTYQVMSDLTTDVPFNHRVSACCTEQAQVYKDDTRQPFVDLANSILRGGSSAVPVFVSMGAVAPGIAGKVDNGDGTIDSTKVTDEDILSIVQNGWPTVAELFYPAPAGT